MSIFIPCLDTLAHCNRFLGPVSGGPAVSQEAGQRQTMLSGWHMPAGLLGRICESPCLWATPRQGSDHTFRLIFHQPPLPAHQLHSASARLARPRRPGELAGPALCIFSKLSHCLPSTFLSHAGARTLQFVTGPHDSHII